MNGSTPRGLQRRQGLARLALLWEAVWPRLWPVLGVLGGFVVLALFALPQRLPGLWHLALLLLVLLAAAALAWRGFRGFAAPDAAAGDRRLERASGLAHRPLAALQDRPAGDDPAAQSLWRAHQARAAAAIGALRIGTPRPNLARRDPRALRAALLLGLAAALVVAGAEAPSRLWAAVRPVFAVAPPPAGLAVEAWVTPPAYTGAAPVFLPRFGPATVPAGSRLQVVVAGGGGGLPDITGAPAAFRPLDAGGTAGAGSFAAEVPLETDVRLAVQRGGATLAGWSLTVQPDQPPTAAFTEPPGRQQRGLGLRLPWRATDDWGLASLVAELRLVVRPGAAPVVLDLALPGGAPKDARGTGQLDLSAHPWAGLEVAVRLRARDGLGQDGGSEPATLPLPERSFNHPVARRLILVRRGLSADPDARAPARRELEEIGATPDAFEHDTGTYLALRVARSRLLFDRRSGAVAEVQELLWEVALALEEGRDGRTQRALQQARDALRDALEEAQRTPPDAAARTEAERRVQELRDAIRQHLEALAERLQRENAEAMPFDPQNRLMDPRELDRRTRRMQEAVRRDRTEEAQRELAELEEMLRALEEGRAARADSPERQQRRERGQQQQGVVQDMVKRQGDMLDRSHQRSEQSERDRARERRQRLPFARPEPEAPGGPGAQQSTAPEAEQERTQDGRRQRALRRALGEVMQQFGDLTGEVPEALGRADQAMRQAQEALSRGGDAREAQARALRALQEGGRQMAQSMMRQFGPAPDGEGEGDPQDMAGEGQPGGEGNQAQAQGEGFDPLGRRSRDANGNPDAGSDTRVPDEAELLRTRRIQEELRRRGAERARPLEELDYIDRLLKRF